MGASGSKATRAAAGAASRQYPKGPKGPRPPTSTPQSNPTTATTNPTTNAVPPTQPPAAPSHSANPTPTKPQQPRPAATRSEAINLDASDPDFARSLRSLGPVQPNPTLSPSSAFGTPSSSAPDPRKNPAIAVLHARARLQEKAEVEERLGRGAGNGREFLDVFELRQALLMRDSQGKTQAQIERRLGLKEGVVGRLGGRGVLAVVDEQGRERKEVDIV